MDSLQLCLCYRSQKYTDAQNNLTKRTTGRGLERAALLCGQIGVLCTLVVGLLNVVPEAVELVAKKRRFHPLVRGRSLPHEK